MKILITGAGVVSAIGCGRAETLDSLLSCRSGIGPVHHLKTELDSLPMGEVRLSSDEMRSSLGIPEDAVMTRTALLGITALKEALEQSGLGDVSGIPFVNGTTVGGMDSSERFYTDFISDRDVHTEYIRVHDCGATTELISDYFGGFRGCTTLSTACSSAANAIILGAGLIRSGQADIVAVGGCECLSDFHVHGFNSLMILDSAPCRPFDGTRAGLNLGEGAGFLILESEESARRRGARPLAELSGYGNACDAFHQTASSENGEGAFLAMGKALAMAGLRASDIAYVNAHGTGTPNNDASESAAMRRIFGDRIPPVSSTKGLTGHTTSASGSIEAVICLLAMEHGFIPGNAGWRTPDQSCVTPVAGTLTGCRLDHVLCNSFGFGGNDSSLLLSRAGIGSGLESGVNGKPVYVRSVSYIGGEMPDPDFSRFVSPMEARRMGKMFKRAVATSRTVLSEAGLEHPDAIITGTWFGSVECTEALLMSLAGVSGQPMKPTHFMQSTHNTAGSLIGIHTRSHGYNATYSHGERSFAGALADAVLQMNLGDIDNALVGVFDEMTPTFAAMLAKAGIVCEDIALSVLLTHSPENAVCTVDELPDYLKRLCGDSFRLL